MSIENDIYQHGHDLDPIDQLNEMVSAHIQVLRHDLYKAAIIYTDDGLEFSVTSSVRDLDIDGCSEYMRFDNAIDAVEKRWGVIDLWMLTNQDMILNHFKHLINLAWEEL